MKLLYCLVSFGLIGIVFGGGVSECGSIESNFLELFDVSESKVRRFLDLLEYIVENYAGITKSTLKYFNCDLNITSSLLAIGTSQITETDVSYIFEILSGKISSPFLFPVSCIEHQLLAYNEYIKDITENVIPLFELQAQQSPLNSSSTCTEVIQYISYYYQGLTSFTKLEESIYSGDLANFTRIGRVELYSLFVDDISICRQQWFNDRAVDLFNIDPALITAYLSNQTSSLPPPYNCAQGLFDSAANQVNNSINNFINNFTAPSPAPDCEPFLSQFIAFQKIWIDDITNLTSFKLRVSIDFPVLVPSFLAALTCELDLMVVFAANATSSLSGVDSEIIFEILNGVINPPFVSPLDCVESYLIAMKNRIARLKNSFIPQLQILTVKSTANTSTCAAAYSSLSDYVPILVNLIGAKGPFVYTALNEFTKINFDGLYLDSMATMLHCVPNILGAYIGSALNGNSNAVTSYSSGLTTRLPYPFSCVKVLINIHSSLLNQAIASFSSNEFVDLTMPKIPKYQG